MDNSINLLWGIVFSSIGLGYFIYGRKQRHIVALCCGIALMAYPYFVSNAYAMFFTGVGLMVVPRLLVI